jgi:hypothetical protein
MTEKRLPIGFGELLASVISLPTLNRQRTAVELLAPFVAGRSVLEIGCGTGRLASLLRNAGCGTISASTIPMWRSALLGCGMAHNRRRL